MNSKKIDSLDVVVNYVQQQFAEHPERDFNKAWEVALAGKKRESPVMYIGHLGDPSDTFIPQGELEISEAAIPDPQENALATELLEKLEPLKMLNPVSLDFDLGKGPGTLVACFGIPLNPETMNCPAYTKSIDEVLSQPLPDPRTSVMMQEMLNKINLIKRLTPDTFKIELPDTQGPFNIGQELPEGKEMETVLTDLARYSETKRLIFNYTGMHWRKKDRPLIREIHSAADEFWRNTTEGTSKGRGLFLDKKN